MGHDAQLDQTLAQLGMALPPAPAPKGVYRPLLVVGNFVYTSGHLPVQPSGELVTGRLGAELDVPAGQAAARLAVLGILASLRKEFGTLDRVRRVIKIVGAVCCTPEFTQQPAVLNGASELLAQVFGPEAGVGVRTALGTSALPLGVPVEIEAVFEVD
jgi:enamine deaminase RidA (YjgF/YER057c/UK114 family)